MKKIVADKAGGGKKAIKIKNLYKFISFLLVNSFFSQIVHTLDNDKISYNK